MPLENLRQMASGGRTDFGLQRAGLPFSTSLYLGVFLTQKNNLEMKNLNFYVEERIQLTMVPTLWGHPHMLSPPPVTKEESQAVRGKHRYVETSYLSF
jgi:hypothetical protein